MRGVYRLLILPLLFAVAATPAYAGKKKVDRERLAGQFLDLIDDALINLPANAWPSLLPDNLTQPVSVPLPLVLSQRMNLTIHREVRRSESSQEHYGAYAVRDTFRIFVEVGPLLRLPIPLPVPILPEVGAKLVVLREWVAVHFVNNEKEGYVSGYWKRYGLPWQIEKKKSVGEAFVLEPGTAIMSSAYYDFTGRLGLSISPFGIDLGGPRVDMSKFRLNGTLIFREDEDHIKVIRETGHGFGVRPYFPLYFIVLYLELYNRDYVYGNYERKVYTFSRVRAGQADEEARFDHSIDRKSGKGHHFKGDGCPSNGPDYTLNTKASTKVFKAMVFMLWQFPRHYKSTEELTFTGPNGTQDHFAHAFAIRETGKTRRSADVKLDLSEGDSEKRSPMLNRVDDATFSMKFTYNNSNWGKKSFGETVSKVNAIAGGFPLLDCDLKVEQGKKLGAQRVTLFTLMNLSAMQRILNASDRASCLAYASYLNEDDVRVCDDAEIYKKRVPIFRFLKKGYFRLIHIRGFIHFLRDLRKKKDGADWAGNLVRFVSTGGKGEPYLATIIRLAEGQGILLHASIEPDLTSKKSYRDCAQSHLRGDDIIDDVFSKFEEPVLYEIDPAPQDDPHPSRMIRTPGEDQRPGSDEKTGKQPPVIQFLLRPFTN